MGESCTIGGIDLRTLMLNETLRPWKLLTFACGLGLLLLGAFNQLAPDWDVPVTLLMTFSTYLAAPWCVRVLWQRCWHRLPLAILLGWCCVDGLYTLYWGWRNPAMLALMRDANAYASTPLFLLCGTLWSYRGSLQDLQADLRRCLSV